MKKLKYNRNNHNIYVNPNRHYNHVAKLIQIWLKNFFKKINQFFTHWNNYKEENKILTTPCCNYPEWYGKYAASNIIVKLDEDENSFLNNILSPRSSVL